MPSTGPNGQNKPALAYFGTSSLSDLPQDLLEGLTATGWNMVSGTGNAALGISDTGIITGRALFERGDEELCYDANPRPHDLRRCSA